LEQTLLSQYPINKVVIRVNTSLHWLIKLASFCWMHTIQKYLAHQDCIDVIQVATLCCQYNIIFCEYTFYRSTYEYPIYSKTSFWFS